MELQTPPSPAEHWQNASPLPVSRSDPAWRTLEKSGRTVDLGEAHTIYSEGDTCHHCILVAAGTVRVQRTSENGNIITLYHLTPGQACELSISRLLSGKLYPAEAVTESSARIVLIPKQPFLKALAESAPFREFIFSSLGRCIDDLVTLVEEVAFGHMEGRLARQLLSYNDNTIEHTHQELAEELGSAREVISRLLKKFEQHHWVRLHRGHIEIISRDILQKLARHIDR